MASEKEPLFSKGGNINSDNSDNFNVNEDVNNNREKNNHHVKSGHFQGQGKLLGSSINLACSAIGIGMLSLPLTLLHLGTIFGVVAFLLLGIISFFALSILVSAAHLTNSQSYQETALKIGGTKLSIFISVVILWSLFGALIGNFIVFENMLAPVLSRFPETKNLSVDLIKVIISILAFFLSLPRYFNTFRFGSAIAVLAHIYIVVAIFLKSVLFLRSSPPLPPLINHSYQWNVIQSIPVIVFAYGCSITVIPIFAELKDQSLITMKKVIFNGMSLAFILYTVVGLFGFLQFQNNTASNILTNYSNTDDLIIIARVLLSVAICFAFPLIIWPMRNTLEQLYYFARTGKIPSLLVMVPLWVHIIESIILIGLALLISILFPSVTFIFSIMGSTSTTICSFIVPSLMFLKVTSKLHDRSSERLIAYFLLIFGLVVGVMGTTATVITQIREH